MRHSTKEDKDAQPWQLAIKVVTRMRCAQLMSIVLTGLEVTVAFTLDAFSQIHVALIKCIPVSTMLRLHTTAQVIHLEKIQSDYQMVISP